MDVSHCVGAENKTQALWKERMLFTMKPSLLQPSFFFLNHIFTHSVCMECGVQAHATENMWKSQDNARDPVFKPSGL